MGNNSDIKLDINHMMGDYLGMEYGIDPKLVDAFSACKALESVQQNRGTGWFRWMDLPYNQGMYHPKTEDCTTICSSCINRADCTEILFQIEECAKWVRSKFDAFVVLGIGGSALGPIAVQQALNHMRWNELPSEKRNGTKLYVEDNVDPERFASLLDVIDVSKTCFNVITKSGETAETMSQYLIVADLLEKAVGDKWHEHIIATTDKAKGNLVKIAEENNLLTFTIPDGVGGRFSELSPVGLLAAAVCGIDIRSMLEGAAAMDARCQNVDIWQNPALLEAVLQYIAMTKMGKNIQVMLPYADSLRSIADWFCQLWAESLGKNKTRGGVPINVGQTPVKALGVTDQHSQLQLYSEGPFDKIVTFIKVERFRATTPIPPGCEAYPNIAFLGGKSHNELIEAERQGTEYALYKAGRMNQTIILPEVSAHVFVNEKVQQKSTKKSSTKPTPKECLSQ